MNDAAGVRMDDRRADIANDRERVGPVQRCGTIGDQNAAQQRAAQPFHREERNVIVAIEFVHAHDVRMRQRLQVLEFAPQLGE